MSSCKTEINYYSMEYHNFLVEKFANILVNTNNVAFKTYQLTLFLFYPGSYSPKVG